MKDYTYEYINLKATHQRLKSIHDAQIRKLKIEIDMLRGKIITPMVVPTFDIEMTQALNIVSEVTGIFQDSVIGQFRCGEFVTARALFCYICRCHLGKSLKSIGRFTNRHHSSVINLVNNYDNYLHLQYKTETNFYNECINRLNSTQGD